MTKIRVALDHLTVTGSGRIVARVWFEADGRAFPGEGWSDFLVPIFCEWLRALRACVGIDTSYQFAFYDGPVKVTVRTKKGRARVFGQHQGWADFEADVDLDAAIAQATALGREIVRRWKQEGWAELDDLEREVR